MNVRRLIVESITPHEKVFGLPLSEHRTMLQRALRGTDRTPKWYRAHVDWEVVTGEEVAEEAKRVSTKPVDVLAIRVNTVWNWACTFDSKGEGSVWVGGIEVVEELHAPIQDVAAVRRTLIRELYLRRLRMLGFRTNHDRPRPTLENPPRFRGWT